MYGGTIAIPTISRTFHFTLYQTAWRDKKSEIFSKSAINTLNLSQFLTSTDGSVGWVLGSLNGSPGFNSLVFLFFSIFLFSIKQKFDNMSSPSTIKCRLLSQKKPVRLSVSAIQKKFDCPIVTRNFPEKISYFTFAVCFYHWAITALITKLLVNA